MDNSRRQKFTGRGGGGRGGGGGDNEDVGVAANIPMHGYKNRSGHRENVDSPGEGAGGVHGAPFPSS